MVGRALSLVGDPPLAVASGGRLAEPAPLPMAQDVSDHAAVQWGRRVRGDVRLLDWWPRGPLPRIDPAELPGEVQAGIREARIDLLRAAALGQFDADPPSWVSCDSDRYPTGPGWLTIGDDYVLVLRRRAQRWLVVTVLARHGLESVYSWRLRRDRRARRRGHAGATKALRGVEPYQRARAGHRRGRGGRME